MRHGPRLERQLEPSRLFSPYHTMAAKMGVKLASSLSGGKLLQRSGAARRSLGAPVRRASTTVVSAAEDREHLPSECSTHLRPIPSKSSCLCTCNGTI